MYRRSAYIYITKPIEHVVLRSQFYFTLLQSNSWDFYQDTKEGKVKKIKEILFYQDGSSFSH